MRRSRLVAMAAAAGLLAACAQTPRSTAVADAQAVPVAEAAEQPGTNPSGDPVPRYPGLGGPLLASGVFGL